MNNDPLGLFDDDESDRRAKSKPPVVVQASPVADNILFPANEVEEHARREAYVARMLARLERLEETEREQQKRAAARATKRRLELAEQQRRQAAKYQAREDRKRLEALAADHLLTPRQQLIRARKAAGLPPLTHKERRQRSLANETPEHRAERLKRKRESMQRARERNHGDAKSETERLETATND
jgi:hypothetical protein